MYKCLILFLLIYQSFSSQAQNSYPYKDKFKLSNGSTFRGQLIRIGPDSIEIELASGYRTIFLNSQVKVRSQFVKQEDKPLLALSSKKNYFDLSFGVNMFADRFELLSGISVEGQFKRRIINNHFLTLGQGLEVLASFSDAYVFPITLGYELVLFEHKASPFLSAKAGYSFVTTPDSDQIDWQEWEAQGGYRHSIGTGYIIPLSEHSLIHFSMHYMVQAAIFELNSDWWGEARRDVIYRRIFFKTGFIF